MNNKIEELVDAMSALCLEKDASEQSDMETLVDLSENEGAGRIVAACCPGKDASEQSDNETLVDLFENAGGRLLTCCSSVAEPSRPRRAKYSKRTKKTLKIKSLNKSLGISLVNPSNVLRVAEISDGNQSLERANFDREEAHVQIGDFLRALELSNQSLEIDPEKGFTIFLKGSALRRYDQAFQCLQMAVELCPGQAHIEDALRRSKAAYVPREYNISEFLLGVQQPPEVEEFIGDVEINKINKIRGRGLFATRDISVGELLLVSNAAVIVNCAVKPLKIDQSHEIKGSLQQDLVHAVLDAAKKSQKLSQQLYELDDGSLQVCSSLPAIDLFHTNCQERTEVVLELKEQGIRDIVFRNSFGGEYKKFAEKCPENADPLGFSGLWLLPSFINHSCLPNASRLHVGKAMFLHAAKPIKEREEITISYFDALLPQSRREKICGSWGFKCKCRRCGLEKSLSTVLESVNAQFEGLHHDALQETNTTMSAGQEFPRDLPKCAEFVQVFEKLEQILAKYTTMKEEEKNWVRASYVTAYLAGMQSYKLSSMDPILSRDEILKAVVTTVPGEIRTDLPMVDQMF